MTVDTGIFCPLAPNKRRPLRARPRSVLEVRDTAALPGLSSNGTFGSPGEIFQVSRFNVPTVSVRYVSAAQLASTAILSALGLPGSGLNVVIEMPGAPGAARTS
jgi:hypothetical protein